MLSGPRLRLACVGEGFEGEVKVRKYQKKGLDAGDFEQLGNTIVDTGEDDLPASFLAGDVGADQRTKPGRIDVGNVGEVEDERRGGFAADGVLELGKIVGSERAPQQKHTLAFHRAGNTFDDEGFRLHGGFIVSASLGCGKNSKVSAGFRMARTGDGSLGRGTVQLPYDA